MSQPYTFEITAIGPTKTAAPGQGKKGLQAIDVTVDGRPLSFQHWDNAPLREALTRAVLAKGFAVCSIFSGTAGTPEAPRKGTFLSATPV